MSTINQRLNVSSDAPVIEAYKGHPDPIFGMPFKVAITNKHLKLARRRDPCNCVVSCALKSSDKIVAAGTMSRKVYLAFLYPNDGVDKTLRGQLVIGKYELGAEASKIVREFDIKGTKNLKATVIQIDPMPKSWTREHRRLTAGTGTPHVTKHKLGKGTFRRHTSLRDRWNPAT